MICSTSSAAGGSLPAAALTARPTHARPRQSPINSRVRNGIWSSSVRRKPLVDSKAARISHNWTEIVDGALYISPRPPSLQALGKTCLLAGLGHAFCFGRGGPGGRRIMREPDLHLG